MSIRFIVLLFIGGAVFMAGSRLPIDYRYEDLKDYIGMLSNVSGMVFTLMGIWIAFLYPNALSRLVNPAKIATADFSETLEDTRRLERIVAAVLQSALVLMAALGVVATKTVLYKSGIYVSNAALFKSGALSIVVVISLVQLEAVMGVVFANLMFINDLHRKRQDKQTDLDV